MKYFKYVFFISIGFIIVNSCGSGNSEVNQVKVIWTLDSLTMHPQALTHITTTIFNNSNVDFTTENWSLHYNHLGGRIDPNSMIGEITITNKAGDYFVLEPTSKFKKIPKGASRTFKYTIIGILDKWSEAPKGMFLVLDKIPRTLELKVNGFDEETLALANPTTAASRYMSNNRLKLLAKDDLPPVIPRPLSYSHLNENKKIGSVINFSASEGLEREIKSLTQGLEQLGITSTAKEDEADITLALNQNDTGNPEGYNLRVDMSGINLSSNSKRGIFYGIQSFLQLVYYAKMENEEDQITIPGIDMTDQPRFSYRGMHLDVSRNFHSKESVMKLLEVMAFFKLNKFHFHITDDEGWRLEIPGLPELTTLGSKRGYTIDEKDHLMPSYGSGYDADNSYGSGYYTKEDFIEILQFAHNRHIEVITEIEMPSHARAAVKSMQLRYETLMAKGDTIGARYYQLHDPDDKSEYRSAQNWNDNAMCICQDGAYNFVEKIFSEVVTLYREAKVPLTTIHVGGDEQPYGAWKKSPICERFIKEQKLKSSDDLPAYFYNRVINILNQYELVTAGWEEMLIVHNEEGHETIEIDDSFIGENVRAYVWNAIIGGGRDDMIYKLANKGFQVVMSNSSAFYYDMAYDRDPDEIGLSWSGYANTEKAFGVEPLDIYYRNPIDGQGNMLSQSYLNSRERISQTGIANLIGLQSQLWSETILDEASIEYLVYPKLLGFAERAWAPKGEWMKETSAEVVNSIYEKEWNLFANTLGQKTLPLLDHYLGGINYRIPEPGGIIEQGKMMANTSFPGLNIMYQLGKNGKEEQYKGPISVKQGDSYFLWSKTRTGRNGRKTKVKN